MQIKNISGIDFEAKSEDEKWVKDLRCPNRNPIDFNQEIIKSKIGDLLTKENVKVLEIGPGWGRNAQFFKDMPNVNYFGFDASPLSIDFFKREKFPDDRFYISDYIDENILNQKYDLIFSIHVLQHIGFPKEEEQFGSKAIIGKLLPQLKKDGFMLFHELHSGQNDWAIGLFVEFLKSKNLNVYDAGEVRLVGGDPSGHNLIIANYG